MAVVSKWVLFPMLLKIKSTVGMPLMELPAIVGLLLSIANSVESIEYMHSFFHAYVCQNFNSLEVFLKNKRVCKCLVCNQQDGRRREQVSTWYMVCFQGCGTLLLDQSAPRYAWCPGRFLDTLSFTKKRRLNTTWVKLWLITASYHVTILSIFNNVCVKTIIHVCKWGRPFR